jgi:hypothetical protein
MHAIVGRGKLALVHAFAAHDDFEYAMRMALQT